MRIYMRDILEGTTPAENIQILDKLKGKYGDPRGDTRGRFWNLTDEDVFNLPEAVRRLSVSP